MKINFDTVAENTAAIHAALSAKIIDPETPQQLLPDLAACANETARRLAILANNNKPPKAEAAA